MTSVWLKRLLLLAVAGFLIGLYAWGAWIARLDARLAISRYEGRCAAEWVTAYVEETKGKWPKSWEDLLTCKPPRTLDSESRDELLKRLRKHVEIDFNVDPRVLADRAVEDYTFIHLDHPWMPVFKDAGTFEELRSALRRIYHLEEKQVD